MLGAGGGRGRRAAAAVVLLGFGASGCWLQAGFDAGRDRFVSGAAPITTTNADELVELWRATGLGGPVNEPLARGGDVYVTTTSGSAARLAAGTGAVGYVR